jgi:anti-anti-sigma factor
MGQNYTIAQQGTVAKITLVDRIDTTNAPALADDLKKLVGQNIEKIVFLAKDLKYISSAGLRAIVFAKQKIGKNTTVFLVGASKEILGVFKMTGFDSFLTVQETYTD